jgi:hypothetical protein
LDAIFKNNIQYIDFPSELGIPKVDRIEQIRLFCTKVYERYKGTEVDVLDTTYDFPELDLTQEIRVVVPTLVCMLETFVFPYQTEILTCFKKERDRSKRQRVFT